MSKLIKKFLSGIFIAGALALMPISQSQAASIGLGSGIPDIQASDVLVDYTYTEMCTRSNGDVGPCGGPFNTPSPINSFGDLTISGSYDFIIDAGAAGAEFQAGGVAFTLLANYTGFGLFDATGSNFSMLGATSGAVTGFDSGTFVTGDLFNAGFSGSDFNGTIEFEFNNTGGDFAAFGDIGGMNISFLTLSPGFSGTWDNDDDSVNQFFQTSFTSGSSGATIDAFMPEVVVIPVPAAVFLFGSGLIALFSLVRIKRTS